MLILLSNEKVLLRQSVPYPHELFGYEISGSLFAPFFRYALILSPYKNKSFPSTIPHCIKSAAEPATKGAAKLVPVKFEYPPPVFVVMMFTDGATKSGFTYITFNVYPFPENDLRISRVASYPPTVITFWHVEGIVRVLFSSGKLNAVSLPTSTVVGR